MLGVAAGSWQVQAGAEVVEVSRMAPGCALRWLHKVGTRGAFNVEFSAAACPEVFVSSRTISKVVYEAVKPYELRKIGSRLYTRNLTEAPERLVRRNAHP